MQILNISLLVWQLVHFTGDYGVVGFSFQYVNYGDFIGTVVDKATDQGYLETGLFSPHASAIGLGYAKKLTDRFSVGGQIRVASQDLGPSSIPNPNQPIVAFTDSTGTHYKDSAVAVSNKLSPLVFDFGIQFETGYKSLVFGMSIRNFSQEEKYAYENFQLPLVFTLGISMDLMDVIGKGNLDQLLNISIDASHYRDHPEQMKIGLEYQIVKSVSLRCGYTTNVDEGSGWTFGMGVSQAGFILDYAYTPYGVFDKVHA